MAFNAMFGKTWIGSQHVKKKTVGKIWENKSVELFGVNFHQKGSFKKKTKKSFGVSLVRHTNKTDAGIKTKTPKLYYLKNRSSSKAFGSNNMFGRSSTTCFFFWVRSFQNLEREFLEPLQIVRGFMVECCYRQNWQVPRTKDLWTFSDLYMYIKKKNSKFKGPAKGIRKGQFPIFFAKILAREPSKHLKRLSPCEALWNEAMQISETYITTYIIYIHPRNLTWSYLFQTIILGISFRGCN